MRLNPVTGRRLVRNRLATIVLMGAIAIALSTATVVGIGLVTARHATKASGLRIGFVRLDRPAPGLRLPVLSGRGTVSLSGLAGKPIVMNFWSSSCHICKSETPALASAARALQGRVAFVGIDTADSRGPAGAFAARYGVPYPIAFDPSAVAAARYRVIGLPVTFFLSPSGRTILGENIGALTPVALRTILRTLYGVR